MDDRSETIRENVEKFLARFMPRGVDDSHHLLFDFDGRYDFAPTKTQLRECFDAFVALVADAMEPHPLYALGTLDAGELALAYVGRAYDKDAKCVSAAVSAEGEATLRQVLEAIPEYFTTFDAFKRIGAIVEYIEASRAVGP
jgi:hypothetical protein